MDFHEVAAVFSDVLGREITYADPSRLAFARHMRARGESRFFVAFMVFEYSVVRLGHSGRTTDTVEAILGRPPTPLRQFVTDHREEFVRN